MLPPDTPVLVLCAGLGTRLRPLTDIRAKPAIPVAGEPMVRRIIRHCATSGHSRFVVNLHHRPESIAHVLGDGSDLGVRVRYSWEQPELLGSGGGPRQALDILGTEPFLVVNGDTLTDLDPSRLLAAHIDAGALVTLAVVPNTAPDKYGGVSLDAHGQVTGFVRRGSPLPSYHFIGMQAARRDAFLGIPAGQATASIGGVYDRLIAERPGSVRAMICEARFWDVGTVADYVATSRALADATTNAQSSQAPAGVVDTIVWDDVTFGNGCRLDRCIVTDHVRVAAGMRVADAILTRGASGETCVIPFAQEP